MTDELALVLLTGVTFALGLLCSYTRTRAVWRVRRVRRSYTAMKKMFQEVP